MQTFYEAGDELRAHGDVLAEAMVARQYNRQKDLWSKYGETGRAKAVRDASYHLDMLADAVAVNEPGLFVDYMAWVKIVFHHRQLPTQSLNASLQCMTEVIEETLPAHYSAIITPSIRAAQDYLPHAPVDVDSFIKDKSKYAHVAREYLSTLLAGDRRAAAHIIDQAITEGASVADIYMEVFQPCQWEVGRLWQMNQISVADEHLFTAGTQFIMSRLYGHIFTGVAGPHRLVATCVGAEMHELGARMVSDLFEMNGWDTHYLGANVPTPDVIAALNKYSPHVLAISATLASHITPTRELILRVRESPRGDSVRILVGGRPFRVAEGLWRHVGADATASDALGALQAAGALLGLS